MNPRFANKTQKPYCFETYRISGQPKRVIASGTAISSKIVQGRARVIVDKKYKKRFKAGEILVTDMTEPDWEPLFKKAKAMVTDSGSRTAHIAIVARELSVPAVVGTNIGTQVIKTGQLVTVDCSRFGTGVVYDGLVPFTKKNIQLPRLPKLATRLMLNTGAPSQADKLALLPGDGVGLARLEFIINEQIKAHPLALLQPQHIKKVKTRKKILKLIKNSGKQNGRAFYVDKLAVGIERIARAFFPREVIIRLSDFKTNEYRHLLGGDELEPIEANPLLGWRGAARYYDVRFKPAFDMECASIRLARRRHKLNNINLLIPYVRTVEEARKVLQLLKQNKISRGKNLKIYLMVEIPSNIILAEKFIKLFDGFSLGSNDLTQLILGVDRGSQSLAHLYNEQNEAVKIMIKSAIEVAHKHNKTVSFCGQAPSDFPEFAAWLVRSGIDSLSLNPDVFLTTMLKLSKLK